MRALIRDIFGLAAFVVIYGGAILIDAVADDRKYIDQPISVIAAYNDYTVTPAGRYAPYKFGPPEDWLGPRLGRRYQAEIKAGQCGLAAATLDFGFSVVYPEAPDPVADPNNRNAFYYEVLPQKYPHLFLCVGEERVREVLANSRIRSSHFRQYEGRNYYNETSRSDRSLHRAIGQVVYLEIRDFGPAYLSLVKLSRGGKGIRLTPEYNYFAVLRAREKGVSSKELAQFTEDAAKQLDAATRADIEVLASDGARPKSKPLVLDGVPSAAEWWFRTIFGYLTGVWPKGW